MPFANATSIAAGAVTPNFLDPALLGGRVRIAMADFTFASDAQAAYTAPIRLPAGARVIGAFIGSTVSLGSTTLAIGISGTAGKYRAAATYTSTDTLTWLLQVANTGAKLTAEEQIIITLAAANAPASGTLRVGFLYAQD